VTQQPSPEGRPRTTPPSSAFDERRVATARAYSSILTPWTVGGGYLNYASEPAGDTLEIEYGAERFARLRTVKRTFDPSNTFRFNHNIPPD
jgi:FAD/FMN-containing dehydrogenase